MMTKGFLPDLIPALRMPHLNNARVHSEIYFTLMEVLTRLRIKIFVFIFFLDKASIVANSLVRLR